MQRPGVLIQTSLAAVCAVALGAGALADGNWVSITPEGVVQSHDAGWAAAPLFVLHGYNQRGLDLSVMLDGVLLNLETTKAGQFHELTWPEAPQAGALGAPAVPVVRRLIVVPHGTEAMVTVDEGQSFTIDLAAAGYGELALPVQAPIEKVPGARESAPFHFDADAYSADLALPEVRASVQPCGIVRGNQIALLEICPTAYNAATHELTVWPALDVSVDFRPVRGAQRLGQSIRPRSLGSMSDVVLNPPAVATSRGSGNYLIVTPTTYEAQIAPYAAAKAAQGFTVTTHVVAPGTANTVIKSYIQTLYADPGTAPEYILLIGDIDSIPHWVGGGTGTPNTDIQYGCMDGAADWYPDIAVGRFSASNATELQTIIDKTLYYENGPLADPDYKKRAVFMASTDNYQISEGTHDYVIDTWLEPNGYVCDKLYTVTYNATTPDVTNSFNDGCFYGVYSGHGGTYSWADGPPFSQADVGALTNDGMFAMVSSFACITGAYVNLECFMETWVRTPGGGAVTAWGSSVNSYWDEDDILEKRLFDTIFNMEDDVKTEVGPCYDEGKMLLLAHYGPTGMIQRYFEMYNLMGDPSLALPAACSEAGTAALDGNYYACEGVAALQVVDCGLNLDDNVAETVDVTIVSTTEPAGEIITLTETDTASAQFEASVSVSLTDAPGVLCVNEADLITLAYVDADDGQGGVNVVVTDTASVDCSAATISNVHMADVGPFEATVTFDANEAVRGVVHYGLSCGNLQWTASGSGFSLMPTVGLSGLQEDTTYYYAVEAYDQAGNLVVDDNGGLCYTFDTTDVPLYFTELTTAFDLDGYTMTFMPNGSVDVYDACIEVAAGLPTDPTGGATLSLSDDGSSEVVLGTPVEVYGVSYGSIFVNSNGNLTFGSGDSDYTETIDEHFDLPRIAALWDDLNPSAGGTVSWLEAGDRVAVTFQGVPEYSTTNSNTFQVEMFYDGTIRITWSGIDVADALVGLSGGGGTPVGFLAMDLSAVSPDCQGSCPEDLDGMNGVGQGDLNMVLNRWGDHACMPLGIAWPCPEDLDGLGGVGQGDLNMVLNRWGDPACE